MRYFILFESYTYIEKLEDKILFKRIVNSLYSKYP